MRSGTRLPAFAVVAAASALLWAGCGGEGGADITEPELGTLEVVTTTAGPEPDPDGYSVSIDDAAPQTMGQNAVVRRDQVPVGTHTVELSGVAANCTVSGPARRTVSIAANAVTSATYAVTCAATTGAIQVTTSTGEPGDADGYRLRLDGADSEPIPADGTVTLAGIAPGPHTVGLTGLSGTCRVESENPVSLAVTAGETATTGFAVRCDPPPPAAGTLELTTTTSGQNLDPDGYRFRIDGGALQDIGINTTVAVSPLAAGDHTVDLRGLAANCAVAGESSRVVTVPDGGVVQLAFDVTCTATTGGLSVSTTTSGEPADPDGYAVTVDGGDPHPVEVNGSAAIDGLAPGSRSVALTGVAANCTVGGAMLLTVPA